MRDRGGGNAFGDSDSNRICASREDHLDALEGVLGEYLRLGAVGIVYLADDNYPKLLADSTYTTCHCRDCHCRFNGNPALEHRRVLERLVRLHAAHRLKTNLYFCPTPYDGFREAYYSLWSDPDAASPYRRSPLTHARPGEPLWVTHEQAYRWTEDYFTALAGLTRDHDICYLLTRFERAALDRFASMGAGRFSYWCNAPRSVRYYLQGFENLAPPAGSAWPLFEGYNDLFTGWIRWKWDLSQHGHPVEALPAWEEIHQLDQRTDSAWICVDTHQPNAINTNEYVWLLWGQFCRDPAGFDSKRATSVALAELYGDARAHRLLDFNASYLPAVQAAVGAERLGRRVGDLRRQFERCVKQWADVARTPVRPAYSLPEDFHRAEQELVDDSLRTLNQLVDNNIGLLKNIVCCG